MKEKNKLNDLTEQTIDMERREALSVIKKAAIYTPPAIAAMLLLDRAKAPAAS